MIYFHKPIHMNNAYCQYISDKYDVALPRVMSLYHMARFWRPEKTMQDKLRQTLDSLPINEVMAYDEICTL